MNEPSLWQYLIVALHLVVCTVLAVYGIHRYILVYLYYKYRRNRPQQQACFLDKPRVTIQLPMYNELYVAQRIIEATCRVDYPRDRLEIQVLDDSTDETTRIAAETVERMRAEGHPVVYLHRNNREGFKAGALAQGLKTATGEYVFIFDADFIPPTTIINDLIDYFVDPKVGMVQARWDHINREQSLLTKTQAVLLDGHFVIEHAARNRSGRFMSFNGTAGAWRRTCIDDAGGWQHDTLTEDLDLSYRAQMKGWRFVYLPDVTSPAELPPEMNSFKSQQHRWAKGGAQTCRKLLPRILRSRLPWRIKLEAFFHLTSWVSYFLMTALTLLLLPVLWLKVNVFYNSVTIRYIFDGSLVILATCSASTFYIACQRELFRTWAESVKYLPFLMSLGVGISINNARAALEGLMGKTSEFVRTPKFGVAGQLDEQWKTRTGKVKVDAKRIQAWIELFMALYMVGCVCYMLEIKAWVGLFFMCLFLVGFSYVSMLTFYGLYQASHQRQAAHEHPSDSEPQLAEVPAKRLPKS
jgi:cellulose synthase/poly-beta-1,6-N-acetylglucosamine synthase-like glycosyltransferase